MIFTGHPDRYNSFVVFQGRGGGSNPSPYPMDRCMCWIPVYLECPCFITDRPAPLIREPAHTFTTSRILVMVDSPRAIISSKFPYYKFLH